MIRISSILGLSQELSFATTHPAAVEALDVFCREAQITTPIVANDVTATAGRLWRLEREGQADFLVLRKNFSETLATVAAQIGVSILFDDVAIGYEQSLLTLYDRQDLFEERLTTLERLKHLYEWRLSAGGVVGLEWLQEELEVITVDADAFQLYGTLLRYTSEDDAAVITLPPSLKEPALFRLSQDDPCPPVILIAAERPENRRAYFYISQLVVPSGDQGKRKAMPVIVRRSEDGRSYVVVQGNEFVRTVRKSGDSYVLAQLDEGEPGLEDVNIPLDPKNIRERFLSGAGI